MKRVRNKQLLACISALCLLIGCLPISLAVAADTVTATAVTAVPAERNLIQGLTPIANAASDHSKHVAYGGMVSTISDGCYPGLNTFVEPVREDGQLVNINNNHPEYGIKNTSGDMVVQFSCWTNDYIDLTFDLGKENEIKSIVVGSTAEPSALLKTQAENLTDNEIVELYKTKVQSSLRLFKGELYVADRADALFTATTRATQWDQTAAATPLVAGYELATPVIGRYVGFRLYIGSGWASLFRVGELAVFATEESKFVTGASVKERLSAPIAQNHLAGKSPIANPISDHSKTDVYQGDVARLTDGRYPGVNQSVAPVRDWNGQLMYANAAHPEYGIKNNSSEMVALFSCWTNDYIDLTFDLGTAIDITSFAIGSTAEPTTLTMDNAVGKTDEQLIELYKTTTSPALRLYKGEFYVADTPASLFGDGEATAAWDFTGGVTPLAAEYILDSQACGRYVGFRLYVGAGWASLLRIGELAVFADPYSEQVVGAQGVPLTSSPEQTSLIAGSAPIANASTDHSKHVAYQSQLTPLTDGAYPGVDTFVKAIRDNQDNLQNSNDAHPEYGILHNGGDIITKFSCSTNDYVDLTFELSDNSRIEGFAIASTVEPKALTKTQAEHWTDGQIEEYFINNQEEQLHLFKGEFFVADTPQTLFDEDSSRVTFDHTDGLSLPAAMYALPDGVSGRYVGFRLYIRSTWASQVRIGELAVFGESVSSSATLPIKGLNSQEEYGAAVANKVNLLKGEAVANKAVDYLQHTGSVIVGQEGVSAAALTDGYINWTTSDDEKKIVLEQDNSLGVATLTYDLRGKAKPDSLLIANSGAEDVNYRIKQVWLYVADDGNALYDASNLVSVITLSTQDVASLIDLSSLMVEGRYVGIRIPAFTDYPLYGYARLTELAVYGTYTDPNGVRAMMDNLLTTDKAVLVDYFALEARGIHNRTAVDENGNPGTENRGEISVLDRDSFWREGDPTLLTDGSLDTLCSMNTYSAPDAKEGAILNYNTPWTVFIYYLGGHTRINSLSLISTAEKDLNIAGVQLYASNRYNELFKNESLLYTSGGEHYVGNETDGYLPDDRYELTNRETTYHLTDEQYAATYRYVAFVVTRPFPMYIRGTDKRVVGYNISRIAELQVEGVVELSEEPMKTSYEVGTDFGAVTVNIAPLNFDDQAFFNNIGTVKITEEDIADSVQRNIENNWLTVAYDKAFHVQVFDKQGKPVRQGDTPRTVEVLFSVDSKETFASGLLKDGRIHRLYNGNTRTDGTLKAGENNYPIYAAEKNNNREKAIIQTLDFSVVLLKYNDKDTIYRLNGAVENKPIVDFFGTDVAGAKADGGADRQILWYLPVLCLPLLTVAGILFHKLCKKNERRG